MAIFSKNRKISPDTEEQPIPESEYLMSLQKTAKERQWMESLRFDPKPDWMVKAGNQTFALAAAPPRQKFWEEHPMEDLNIKSDLYKAYRLSDHDASVSPNIPMVCMQIATLTSQISESPSQFFAVLNKKVCVLIDGTHQANRILDDFWQVISKYGSVGAMRRTAAYDKLTSDDLKTVIAAAENRKKGFACILDGLGTGEAWTDREFIKRITSNENIGAAVTSERRLVPSDYYNDVVFHYQECEIEDVQPAYGKHFIAFNPNRKDDMTDIYRLQLSGRPRVSAIGASAPPHMPEKFLEVVYLIMMLQSHGESTTAKNIAAYLNPKAANKKEKEIFTTGLLRSASEQLGKDISGRPRLYTDDKGNWRHSMPADAEGDDLFDPEGKWGWYMIFEDTFEKMRKEAAGAKK